MQDTSKNFYKKLLGNVGEKKAKKFLEKNGYKILKTNYKTRIGEIDIIGENEGYLCFIEVKTRMSNEYGEPSEAVNKRKQQKYGMVATEYLLKNKKQDSPCRFDVVEVIENEINLIKDAFSM